MMTVRIILSCEEGSAQFSDRVFTLSDSGQVRVARASGEEHPGEDNAVFDCKVRCHIFFNCILMFLLLGFVSSTGSFQFS